MEKRRAVIIGGAAIGDYPKTAAALRGDDFFIFCDSGLYHRECLGVQPSLVIGDFDSHPLPSLACSGEENTAFSPPEEENADRSTDFTEPASYGQVIRHTRMADGTELIILPHMKDWTDTVYAAMEAERRGFREVLLIGASGGRPDLYFGNISILNRLEMKGIEAWMADDISKMRVLNAGSTPVQIPDTVKYFSLLAYDGPTYGITVTGALYPLENASMTADDPYGVSNEVLPGETASISFEKGKLLVITID